MPTRCFPCSYRNIIEINYIYKLSKCNAPKNDIFSLDVAILPSLYSYSSVLSNNSQLLRLQVSDGVKL